MHGVRETASDLPTDQSAPTWYELDEREHYVIENRTPFDIEIERDGNRLIVPGLAARRMSGARLKVFEADLVAFRQLHRLRVVRHQETPPHVTLAGVAVLAALLALPLIVVVRFLQDGTLLRAVTGLLIGAALLIGALALVTWLVLDRRHQKEWARAARADGDVAFRSSGLIESRSGMGYRIVNLGVLILLIGVGAVLPATWIYFGTEFHQIAPFEDGLTIQPEDAAEATWRSIQITYVAVLVMLPAMLYFLFDRVHINSLVHQWSRDIFRLDRRVDTLAELEGRYGHKLAEATKQSPNSRNLVGSKRSPIIVATILFAVGWTLLILPTRSRDTTEEIAVGRAEAAAEAAQEAAQTAATATGTDAAIAARDATEAAAIADAAAQEATGGAIVVEADGSEAATSVLSPGEVAQNAATLASQAAAEAKAAQDAAGSDTFQIFDPEPSAATAAFLGAYFFSLFAALRGFSRRDLRPKLYVSMAARVALTASAAFLIVVVTPYGESPTAIALAFLAGVTPLPIISAVALAPFRALANVGSRARTGTPPSTPDPTAGGPGDGSPSDDSAGDGTPGDGSTNDGTTDDGTSEKTKPKTVRKYFARVTGGVEIALANRRPFTVLDHVDLFESARLEGEGVPDVESLAHSDIVDLMVATRLPAGRLVDWIDQALLVIHLGGPGEDDVGERIDELRALGLRTATDLVDAVDAASDPASGRDTAAIEEVFDGREALDDAVGAIKTESNFDYVSCWKRNRLDDPRAPRMFIGTDGGLRRYVGLQEIAELETIGSGGGADHWPPAGSNGQRGSGSSA